MEITVSPNQIGLQFLSLIIEDYLPVSGQVHGPINEDTSRQQYVPAWS
jgi:hypothetical protein